jgi:hypothetical protein
VEVGGELHAPAASSSDQAHMVPTQWVVSWDPDGLEKSIFARCRDSNHISSTVQPIV